jgi:cell division initiation protein
MKITPQDIHQQEFKGSMRGYDKDEVDAFLQMIAEQLEETVKENAGLQDKVKELEERLAEYQKNRRNLEEALLAAQKITEQMKENAEKEAQVKIREAQVKADKILAEAVQQSQQYNQEISKLRMQRDQMIAQFKSILEQNFLFLKSLTGDSGKKS